MAKQVVEACVNAGTCAAGASHYAALISALASIWSQVKHQLVATMNNDLIGGSVALAVASTLVGVAWRLWRWIRGVAHDRMFVSYEIPSGTPQYFAALRWLYDQPAVRRASRRLVVNPVGTPLANETRLPRAVVRARRPGGSPWSSACTPSRCCVGTSRCARAWAVARVGGTRRRDDGRRWRRGGRGRRAGPRRDGRRRRQGFVVPAAAFRHPRARGGRARLGVRLGGRCERHERYERCRGCGRGAAGRSRASTARTPCDGILAAGPPPRRGTARRFTRVYLPSAVVVRTGAGTVNTRGRDRRSTRVRNPRGPSRR